MGAIQSVMAWWPGDDTNYVVLGFSVKTWGRAGKLMQYTGGLVALIDIVGEERFAKTAARISERYRRVRVFVRGPKFTTYAPPALLLLLISPVLAPVLFSNKPFTTSDLRDVVSIGMSCLLVLFSGFLVSAGSVTLLQRLGRVAASPVNLKGIGFVILTIGFALDFLAS